ncbi:MAG: sodium:solute symporter [Lentisphaerae bacterium]|nr:sodium:solute symporter [Lentisphaerota bacterium]
MNALDWAIVAAYMLGMIGMSAYVGWRQKNAKDYYLGSNNVSVWSISLSTMATQCSTNSLLGAPAFVIAVGGLLWLQYELAVPLAMIGVMLFLLPFFRKQNVISVYEYLEKRFGPGSRTVLSVLFQFLRAFSTGVTVYGISRVIEMLVGIPFWQAVLILGTVTVLYDMLGGIRAVIYSDVVQMAVLYTGIVVCLYYAVSIQGGWSAVLDAFPAEKGRTLDFSGFGFTEGKTFAFWPMLIGGFFLYLSYYGCDQTQVQRELSTRSVDDTNMSLFMNGILRFPLVITYCLVGVALAAYIARNPEFIQAISHGGAPDYNLAVPVFCVKFLPHGVIGLIIVSLFAAAMSSLDSTINSLSATTMRDIVERFMISKPLEGRTALICSRGLTVFWGGLCVVFSFFVGDVSKSIIESINKIGSLANGPILAAFLLAILTRRANDQGVVIGIVAGFVCNLLTWKLLPGVSWLWWNVSGCLVTFSVGYLVSLVIGRRPVADDIDNLVFHWNIGRQFRYQRNWLRYQVILVVYFVAMVAVLAGIQRVLG